MHPRRLAASAAAATLLVALPALPVYLQIYVGPQSSPPLLNLGARFFFLLAPGLLAYPILAAPLMRLFPNSPGTLELYVLPPLAVLSAILFWTAILYLLLSAIAHLRSRRQSPQGQRPGT